MPASTLRAALEALDAEFDRDDYATTLVDGDTPCLTIANRHAQLSEDVYTDGMSYLWPWGQRIAAVGNPKAAAAKSATSLVPPPRPAVADPSPAPRGQGDPGNPGPEPGRAGSLAG